MRPPENLTTRSVDTSTTFKYSSSTVAKGQARQDDNAYIQGVPKHHQQVDELDISNPGFREVPANVTRITAGTRSAAAPPPNQPQAAPLNRRQAPTRKSKKKNRLGDNSDSGSDSDSTNPQRNDDGYSASRRAESAPEVPEAAFPAEYQRQMRQKGFDWMLKLKKAGQICEEFHEQCAKNREIGREMLDKLANDPRASQPGTTDQIFTYPSTDLSRIPWNHQALRASFKVWESRRRAHFDKVLYSYFQASLGNDCQMDTPIDMFDTPQRIVEAVDAEMVHCLGHFNRREDSAGTNSASESTNKKELICEMVKEMYRSVEKLPPAQDIISWGPINMMQTESSAATKVLKQQTKAMQVPEMSTVGQITRAYVRKIIALIESDYKQWSYIAKFSLVTSEKAVHNLDPKVINYESTHKIRGRYPYMVRSISNPGLEPIDYLRWILNAKDEDSLLASIRELQWKQNQKLRDSYRIRQELFYPGDSRPGFGWSVLWSWDQPKIFEEFSKLSMAKLGWFYEESEQERYVQYQRRSAYLDEHESRNEVIIKVSMTEEVIGMYLSNGRLLTLDS
ncbi:hypothetical protein CcaCcLH18_04439 [Colletotrichum camelliae]|nr:hypothetical protein CcaCcLH18_04439 [Colletotrichum camelliae]